MHAQALELLSPAKNADIGIEAINHGADAVYIGGPSFGARSSAENSVADIARLVQHAHRFHSQVFVALNTILRDDELPAAQQLVRQLHDAGVDALIIQDMGLLELDLPPMALHASTQCDIRTPEKARFLQDAGLSQLVLARELTVPQIQAIQQALTQNLTAGHSPALLEFFVHGALCVAYSGQCNISHAQTGRSANRGDCSQACRLPYQVQDAEGRFIAHDKHVLSMKDNNQSANLAALVDAGIRSFKIEGRYKDMGYVKNITAHYRLLLDELLEQRPELARASSGRCTYTFQPDPNQNFNREFTDYFVNGRKEDIGAFDSPKNPGQLLGWVSAIHTGLGVGKDHFDLEVMDANATLSNGDGLCYYNEQKELVGLQTNRVERLTEPNLAQGGMTNRWRVYPKDAFAQLPDLRKGRSINRNRSMDWVRTLEKPSAQRRMGLWMQATETPASDTQPAGLRLTLTDEDGFEGQAHILGPWELAKDPNQAPAKLEQQLSRLGDSVFELHSIDLKLQHPWFIPASTLNGLRRQALTDLEAQRLKGWQRPTRCSEVSPPTPYPEDTLSYLGNVFNHKARDFYARHGVKVIEAAYEANEADGEVSLMITKHCVRFSLSLCPKQAKGVTGVQGTVKAEPLVLVNGKERLTLRFDCKPCEMHVVGKRRKGIPVSPSTVAQPAAESVIQFYTTRPQKQV